MYASLEFSAFPSHVQITEDILIACESKMSKNNKIEIYIVNVLITTYTIHNGIMEKWQRQYRLIRFDSNQIANKAEEKKQQLQQQQPFQRETLSFTSFHLVSVLNVKRTRD